MQGIKKSVGDKYTVDQLKENVWSLLKAGQVGSLGILIIRQVRQHGLVKVVQVGSMCMQYSKHTIN